MKRIEAIGLAVLLMLVPLMGVIGCIGAGADDSLPPIISDITVSCVTGSTTTVMISWTTNEPATGNIEYGLDRNYGSVYPSPPDTLANQTKHSWTLSNLSPDTDYHFRIRSSDDAGNEAISWHYRCPTFITYSTGATWISDNTPPDMGADQSYTVSIVITNNGGLTWPCSGANPVEVTYHWQIADSDDFAGWDGLKSPLTSDVEPGESTTVNATVTAPSAPGSYILQWDMVYKGFMYFSSAGGSRLYVPVEVTI